mmetsp:Transcript_20389/g.63926  ORF Transcript_20389/g.63926 Transcript_20389/m.63926 type:complete len:215 (+) Transcript_20389:52-696(+)
MPGPPPKDNKTPPMGLLTFPNCEVWRKHIENETRDLARHMAASFGRNGELLPLPRQEAAPEPEPWRLRPASSAPTLPAYSAPPKALAQNDPSLVGCAIGTRRWRGSYTLNHAHSRIGGAADGPRLRPPSPLAAALPPATGSREAPARLGSAASAASGLRSACRSAAGESVGTATRPGLCPAARGRRRCRPPRTRCCGRRWSARCGRPSPRHCRW